MIESELFGYEKGAFTGAQTRKLGLLEVANKGTLFLDEIGDMPLALQVKLLRVIETGTFFRLGGTREQKVDVRIVAATNKDLKAEIARGSFRQDLYYRISSFIVHIMPLRDRPEDIPALIAYFTERSPEFRHKRFSKEALAMLSRYPWPGNVRELQNVLHRALLLSKNDIIEPSDLPLDLCGAQLSGSARLEDVEREHILKILKASGGQRNRAAEALGIDPKTLYRKLVGYGLKE
jgi:DNA-binding NtrC family response regulator